MQITKLAPASKQFPPSLRHIPSPPNELFCRGDDLASLLKRPRVAIVGSRNVSVYGRQVTLMLASQLAEQGIVIVSGLALGVDALAHRAALDVDGLTIAVLPCSLDKLYPATNAALGAQIVAKGGALVSEYDFGAEFTFKQNFIARNRLIAGLADVVLITEAAQKSGSLHTARFALDQGKDVLAVPGNITSPGSEGTNNLIRAGATPVTCVQDVLFVLGLTPHTSKLRSVQGRNPSEQSVLELLLRGISDGGELLKGSRLSVSELNQTITMLEISGKIRSLGSNNWALR